MGRPEGTRNPGYTERRAALALRLLPRLLQDDGVRCSFNDLAAAADVSVPTLRHYFGDRDGAVVAALKSAEALGAAQVETLATPSSPHLETSMRDAVFHILLGWRSFGVDRIFAGGLNLGLAQRDAGPAFLSGVLEPAQQALERRLRVHALRGEAAIDDGQERAAALGFVAPLLVALLHQGPLGGEQCRPLDVAAFVDVHVAAFVRAWAPR
jgi:AcrR family transcriptional regulator